MNIVTLFNDNITIICILVTHFMNKIHEQIKIGNQHLKKAANKFSN